ncbi:hypothetical protein DdX_21161 [Ditylenchus destructor]|uniref:Uncharacterized protein n=1 Tax=Ditylenchus destructor TaxID=166010 RepID=A0AAD4MHR7_9BILA|nr:hypothetical protein DdX_21161 [Ditylenchus destructor]
MESVAYLWRDGEIRIRNAQYSQNFQRILNSPTLLQCQKLNLDCAQFSFKDYKVLYSVKVIETNYNKKEIDPENWPQFLEQPGVKPVVVLRKLPSKSFNDVFDILFKSFSSAVLPNAFKIAFVNHHEPLTEFREMNNTSGEILELKTGFPTECQAEHLEEDDRYTLERSSI